MFELDSETLKTHIGGETLTYHTFVNMHGMIGLISGMPMQPIWMTSWCWDDGLALAWTLA